MTAPVLGTPSAYALTRAFLLSQCSSRGWPTNITMQVPRTLPTGRRFWTLERLNTQKPFIMNSSQLMQLRYYDPDGQRCEHVADQAMELWLAMPTYTDVQDVEHAGGPTRDKDPDIPDLERYVMTAWVTVMNTPLQ